MRHTSQMLGPLLLLALLAGGVSTANAFELVVNGNPYLCAVVEGGKTTAGTPVIAYPCSGGPEDQWQFLFGLILGIGTTNADHGGYGYASAMCLDVKGGGTAPGTLVDLWPCNVGGNQFWHVNPNGGKPQIQSDLGNLCLDSAGGPAVGGGVQLVINPCSSAASQTWALNGIQIQSDADAFSPFVCANVKGSKTASGTPVLLYSCDDAPNELWTYANGELRGIGSENGTFKCLTASSLSDGALVELSTCNGQSNQIWSIFSGATQNIAVFDGVTFYCLDGSSGTQLEVNSGSTSNCFNNGSFATRSTNWHLR